MLPTCFWYFLLDGMAGWLYVWLLDCVSGGKHTFFFFVIVVVALCTFQSHESYFFRLVGLFLVFVVLIINGWWPKTWKEGTSHTTHTTRNFLYGNHHFDVRFFFFFVYLLLLLLLLLTRKLYLTLIIFKPTTGLFYSFPLSFVRLLVNIWQRKKVKFVSSSFFYYLCMFRFVVNFR